MLTLTHHGDHHDYDQVNDNDHNNIRDIHDLTPPLPLPPGRHHPPSPSLSSEATPSEIFTTVSREFNALVLAGAANIDHTETQLPNNNSVPNIYEEENYDNPLAIVPDHSQLMDPAVIRGGSVAGGEVLTVQKVKKEEVVAKISAWQNDKIAKINNRFKREDVVINGWESEQVQKASSWMKKVERKIEEKRAKALEKMQNDVAKARRKAEERRASAEAKRGTKVARVLEIANLMRAVGRAPVKRSYF
jgi:hypothetical protein